MALISWIQAKISSLVNFLFGKTEIFIILLGWFLVVTGILFLLRPEKARQKLFGQGFGFIKAPLLIATIYLSLLVLSLSDKFAGMPSKIIALVIVIILIRLFLSLKKKTYEKLREQFAKIPLAVLKIYAALQICVGVLMLVMKHRIW